ncbi:helix-turn-helix domain-containing protein [Providencia alcalifaciens]|uniref:helix-turn-helix domain-containing protein n=1 Tax=Providencia alcalifaciens TaxID=126385 RepID=UPI00029C5C6D|nr:helix-turn-helix transcriptional regulator [Providencia alcalifaciens]EKT61715.1 putative transcriptional regulator [Providencia alcalifaciens Dmel2]
MVPKRLKEARKAAGLSQGKLLELLEIEGINNSSRLSSYEVGRNEPSFEVIKKIAKVLDYPAEYFYAEDDDFALTILELYKNRMNLNTNPHYNAVIALKKTTKKLEEIKKLHEQMSEYLKP